MGLRVGIDTGGTFTDLIAIDELTNEVYTLKTPSTPGNPALACINSLREANLDVRNLGDVIHGTTVGTNAMLERRTAVVGVLTTRGFRDTLETRRLWREFLFGNWWERPKALIPRRLRREIPERLGADGLVVTPLDEEAARQVIRQLREAGVNSYAVCFLHSYLNPAHEQRVAELIAEEHPGAAVTLSSHVLPEIREYERMSTTVVSAMLKPVMMQYLNDLESRVAALAGHPVPVRVMKCNGGLMLPSGAAEHPVETLFSGPAGGVSAALHLARTAGLHNVITFDMGGTSTDVSLISNNEPIFVHERDLEWNIPVRAPMLDIKSIGAGGGSIAWLDRGGALQVGPRSAGADPGPVCYGRGGTLPTVTDANLVLNRLSPDAFLGGRMRLDYEAARCAVEEHVARHFGWNAVEAAYAIYRISLAHMALLVREMTINRGYDPRDFTLMCFGGSGAVFAGELAAELGIPRVMIPIFAGVFSAYGGLMSDLTFDFVQACYQPVEDLDLAQFNQLCASLACRASQQFEQMGVRDAGHVYFFVDLRYAGESYELMVPLLFDGQVTAQDLEAAVRRFHERHRHLYSFDRPIEPVEMVAVRVRGVSTRSKPPLKRLSAGKGVFAALWGERDVYFREVGGFVKTPVFLRNALGAGVTIDGPAVIEDEGTTILVFPRHKARLDDYGNILMEVH